MESACALKQCNASKAAKGRGDVAKSIANSEQKACECAMGSSCQAHTYIHTGRRGMRMPRAICGRRQRRRGATSARVWPGLLDRRTDSFKSVSFSPLGDHQCLTTDYTGRPVPVDRAVHVPRTTIDGPVRPGRPFSMSMHGQRRRRYC